ncbi:MAG: DNA cytosine methyltransferase [Oscillospiraceae bacterium]|nr:DNA cytosine methyltransferase [Oscillospiraceae bacterium]
MVTAVSLFTGAGGMDIGFEKAGVKVVLANELDKRAAETYSTNHPNVNIIVDDINNISDELEKCKGVDLVFGGPPCQGFSVIGKMDPEDIRSQLIWSFLNAVDIIKPKAFVMENVKALAHIKKWKPVKDEFIEKAKEIGYGCVPFIVNAAEHGTPQKRERVFFIGIRDNYDFEDTMRLLLDKQKRKAPVIRELFKDLGPAGSPQNPKTCNAKITYAERPVMRKIPYDCLMFNGIGRPIDPDGYSRTITASQGGNMTLIVDDEYLHDPTANNWIQEYFDKLVSGEIKPSFAEAPSRLRRLTINETRRIQTFPDDYVFCGAKTSVYKQIGNAVPCEMAKSVASAVVEFISKE